MEGDEQQQICTGLWCKRQEHSALMYRGGDSVLSRDLVFSGIIMVSEQVLSECICRIKYGDGLPPELLIVLYRQRVLPLQSHTTCGG